MNPGRAPLSGLNPLAWLAGNLALVTVLVLWRRPATPEIALIGILALGVLAGAGLRDTIRRLAPFLVLASFWALGSILFYNPGTDGAADVLGRVGPVVIYRKAVEWGTLRALRLLDMIAFGILLIECVRADDLALSLAQTARIPYRYAFVLQTAYRMIPSLSEDAEQIARAQVVRGVPVPRGPVGRLKRLLLAAAPLLAGALRRADRMALVMESRGFGAYPTRTYRRRVPFRARDAAFLAGVFLSLLALTLCDRI